jgi:hypothetical protein
MEARMKSSKKWILSLIPLITLAVVACSCPFSLPTPSETEAWQEDVDQIISMTHSLRIPGHLLDPEKPATEDVFDPNTLIDALDHISMQEGYVLDFVYRDDGMGANPILYARPENEAPFENFEAFTRAAGDCSKGGKTSPCSYMDFIISDGTEQGYFQWVLMRMMGDQFYLYWHANYHDAEIIASQESLETLTEQLSSEDFGMPIDVITKQKLLRVDPAPVVTIKNDIVTVRVVWFTKWGGLHESIYTLNKEAPHEVLDIEIEELVPYDCGIMF